jgi:hypothetical protein
MTHKLQNSFVDKNKLFPLNSYNQSNEKAFLFKNYPTQGIHSASSNIYLDENFY